MKALFTLILAVLLTGCAGTPGMVNGQPAAALGARQLYAPVAKFYTPDEARGLSIYRKMKAAGVPAAELDAPVAFVQIYTDTMLSIWGHQKKPNFDAYIASHLRAGVGLDTILAMNRWERGGYTIHSVIPRSNTAAYACITSSGIGSIAGCIEDVVKAQTMRKD